MTFGSGSSVSVTDVKIVPDYNVLDNAFGSGPASCAKGRGYDPHPGQTFT